MEKFLGKVTNRRMGRIWKGFSAKDPEYHVWENTNLEIYILFKSPSSKFITIFTKVHGRTGELVICHI